MRSSWVLLAGVLWVGTRAAMAVAVPCSTAQAAVSAAADRRGAEWTAIREVNLDLRAGRVDAALKAAQALAVSDPQSSAVAVLLGSAFYHNQKPGDAVDAFNHALQLDPCNGRAHYFAWRLFSLAGQKAAADQQLEFAHELAPQDAVVKKTWDAVQRARLLQSGADAPVVTRLAVLRDGFFAKRLSCDGVPILSSAAVDDAALVLACGKIRTMLVKMPKVRASMIAAEAELHVIGDREATTDLPENRRFKSEVYVDAAGKNTNMDERARGVGGRLSSCGEENLLGLPNDRYDDGSDTCTHEFAHDIMENGFTNKQRALIERGYKESLQTGHWKGAYAAVNVKEYWAEISMWYFGSHGNRVIGGLEEPGPEALKAYDPGAFALVDGLYSGQL